ncbi:endodeoxyribonuclease [Neonectria magnoliae]|uniref:Endodeoxyribonuclease n=1 Tax=Neonectria magnoliae TaxID=2732573 RepID=A0ABR1IFK0_9HYPO
MEMDSTARVVSPSAAAELMHCSQGDNPPPPPSPPPPTGEGDDSDSDTNTTTVHGLGVVVGSVVTRIETILEAIADSLAACQELSIALSRRGSHRRASENRLEHVCFPGRTVQEARKFGKFFFQSRILSHLIVHPARILLILQLSHDALVSGTILTKRHIYYQHQDLFEKQSQVDELVDDLALTLGVNRGDLNIVAASKGVLAGRLVVELKDGSRLDPTAGNMVSGHDATPMGRLSLAQGIPIPTTKSISKINLDNLRWILVVEKDVR